MGGKKMTKRTTTTKPKAQKATQKEQGFLGIAPYEEKKGEEYMNANQLTHFRNLLNKWKQQLMEEADSTVYHMKEDAALYPDPIDRASQEEGFNLELRTRDRERKLLKKIEQALDKIDKGDYGFCEDCGAEIGIRRLEARPTAVKCIDCKTFEEIKERQLTEE
jgi:DnaK suppressor protein